MHADVCYCIVQFTANPKDFYGNRLKAIELALCIHLNLTYGFDKAVWTTELDFIAYPTLVNAAYNQQTNQICKQKHAV